MNMTWTVQTGFGVWNPVGWLIAFGVALGIAMAIRTLGRKDFRKDDGRKPFISGNEEPAHGGGHIPASNMYWGFLESMKTYYGRIVPLHTGVLTDYLTWVLAVMALMLVIGLMT